MSFLRLRIRIYPPASSERAASATIVPIGDSSSVETADLELEPSAFSDAASVADSVDIIAEAPEGSLETPVLYPVGLVEDKEASEDDTAAAEAFLEYLQSDEAIAVFEKYGFASYVTDEEADDAAADTEAEEEPAEDTAE